jgi:tetratricopeptide (TPR) repeat protein
MDGIPLAIELAAAQARVLAPGAIAARLDDCLRLLTGANRLAPTRQQTIRASLDWSYNLLSPGERVVFRRLAVLAGTWSLQTAEAVCAADDVASSEVLSHLIGLVDKSLVLPVERDGELLYRLLEPVRQYAAHCLAAAGELESTQDRQTRHCVHLAKGAEHELSGPGQNAWLRRLDLELDNIRTVLSRAERCQDGATILGVAGPLYYFVWLRRHLHEGRHWYEAGLGCGGEVSPELRAKGLFGLMLMLSLVGENAEANSVGQQATATFQELGDSGALALVLVVLAQTTLASGDVRRAHRLAEDAVMHAGASASAWSQGHALMLLGHVLRRQGETTRAVELYREALLLFEDRGDAWSRAFALASIGLPGEAGSSVARVAGLASLRWSWEIRDLPALASALEYLALYGGPQPRCSLIHCRWAHARDVAGAARCSRRANGRSHCFWSGVRRTRRSLRRSRLPKVRLACTCTTCWRSSDSARGRRSPTGRWRRDSCSQSNPQLTEI